MKVPTKCPVCNSTRITGSKEGLECKRCGYTHKPTGKLNCELEKFKDKNY